MFLKHGLSDFQTVIGNFLLWPSLFTDGRTVVLCLVCSPVAGLVFQCQHSVQVAVVEEACLINVVCLSTFH
jgi:hypothetical protein